MEIRNTKIGRMFKIISPWHNTALGDVSQVRESDIIGLEQYHENRYTSDCKTIYELRVSFIVGHGINGTGSDLKVTKETYEAVAHELGLN